MDTPHADMYMTLAQLSNAYCERLPRELATLADLAAGLIDSTDARQRLEDLIQRLHKLAGSGGTFGLHVLSSQAQSLENIGKSWLTTKFKTITLEQRQAFIDAIAALPQTLNQREEMFGTTTKSDTTKDSKSPDSSSRRIHIWLAMDDDGSFTEKLIHPLGQFGYEVNIYTQANVADTSCIESPDVLVVDMELLDSASISGSESFSQHPVFKAWDCPIFAIAAQDDFQSRRRAARLGAEGFLLKPLDVPRLVDHIERALGERYAPPFRVLIVDDELDSANRFRQVLSAAGMEAAVLTDPEAVIDIIGAFRPEFVLLDMHMPECSGPELAAVIRHYDEWVGLPIVYLCAATDRSQHSQDMRQVAADFITKTITDAHLVAAVKIRAIRFRQLAHLMSKDSLTGLLKHTRIKETIALELIRAQRSGKPLSVAMLDIDQFKIVNDNYGHAAGDRVIMALAHLLKQCLRKGDGIGRYGGEEFVAILPECDYEMARRVLDDIRVRFAALRFQHGGQEFFSTVSIGIAYTDELATTSSNELLVAADRALAVAKQSGRNQVRLAPTATTSEH